MSIKNTGAGIAVALTLVLSMVVGVASTSALTTSELINLLIAAGVIAPDKVAQVQALVGGSVTTPTSGSGYVFNTNLTMGARGADVTALQDLLISGGYLTMPAGVAKGYFGALTRSAVIQYQIAKGITPAAGYVGAITRAALNATVVVTPGTPGVPSGTDLRVSLAATSPATGSIIAGQAAANLAEFTFTNTSATPAIVTNVTLARTGVSADTTLSNVYLFDGAVRLTDSATVSSGKITFNASNGLFTIPAGSSKTISVKSDILSTSNGQLVGVSLTGVTSNVPVSASYPVSGANMNVFTASDIATVSMDLTSGLTGNITAGSLNQTVWSSALTISGRAVNLKSLALKVIGSVPSDALQNIKLYASGIQVASASGVDANGMITFDLSSAPFRMDSSRTLEVRADVTKGSTRTFTVGLQNTSDLQVIDSNYNVAVAPTLTDSQTTGTWTVSAGSVSVSLDTSLSSGDVVTGASNVPLARYTFKAYGEDMKISYLQASTSHVGGLQNVALFANGLQIGSTQTISSAEATANTPKLFSLGSSLIIPAGQTVTVEVRGDIKNADGTNATTTSATTTDNQVIVVLAGYASNAQGSFSQQLSTVPAVAGVTGPTMTVKSATATLAANSAVSNSTSIPNVTNQRIGSYVLQSSASEPIRVTSLTVTIGGAAGAITNVSNLYVAVEGSTPTTPISPAASNNFTVDFTVPANTTKTINVYADLSSTTGVASTTLALNGYGVNSNVTVTKSAVTGQTVTVGAGSLAVPTLKTGSGYSPDAQFVVGDTTQTIGYYNLVSTNGTSRVTELTFAASTTGSTGIVEVTVGGKVAPMVSGVATVSGLALDIPVGYGGTNVPVTVKYNTVGLGGITSNAAAGLRLTGMKYTAGNAETSTTTLAVETNLMTVVGSKPTVTISNPTDNTVGAGGSVIVARVTVAADAKGPVTLLTLPLSMQAAGAGSSAGTLTVKVGGSTVSTSEGMGAVGTTTAATGTVTLTGGYEIAAGTSVTFEIWDTVTFTSTDDSLRTTLGSSSLFTWKDVIGNVTGITGASIYNYPTNTALLAY